MGKMDAHMHLNAERIQAFLDGALGTEERVEVEKHAASCTRCQADLDGWRLLFSELGGLPELGPSEGFGRRVLAGIETSPASRPEGSLQPEPGKPWGFGWLGHRVAARWGHIGPGRLQDYAEGFLTARRTARVEAHLDSCRACRRDAEAWGELIRRIEGLPELAPSAGFAPQVMAEIRARRSVSRRAAARGRAGSRARARHHFPGQKAWAALSGVAVTPIAIAALLGYAVFSNPAVTPGYLASFLWWNVSSGLAAAAELLADALFESGWIAEAYLIFNALAGQPGAAALGAVCLAGATSLSGWVLYRNLVPTRRPIGTMRGYRFNLTQLPLTLAGLVLLPAALAGQVREVVSSQMVTSEREAGLSLEFADDGLLEIVLGDGVVRIDGEPVGQFVPGDALDTAWRALLDEIVGLAGGSLGQALEDWTPPPSLSGDALDAAETIDESLHAALRRLESSDPADPDPEADASPSLRLRTFLTRTAVFGDLVEALGAIDALTSSIYVRENVRVGRNEVVEGPIVISEGRLTVDGTINGDVFIVEGSITVNEGAEIHGDIRLVNSSYSGVPESALAGRVVRVDSRDPDLQASDSGRLQSLEIRIRNEMREEIRDEIRDELRREFPDTPTGVSPLRAVGRGIADVMGDVITFLIVSLIALAAVYFAKSNLEVVADAARLNPVRAGLVGGAGVFLLLPAWVTGCVALAISVVGILALPFWLVLFPVAVALAATLGYLSVARNVGEWLAARQTIRGAWPQPASTFYAVITGVGAMLAFSVVSHVLDVVPFLGLLSKLVAVLGSIIVLIAVLVGFGAVLLTRGGRQPEFYGGGDFFTHEPAEAGDPYPDEVIETEEDGDRRDRSGDGGGG